jgi:thioesterase domain-containing protein
VHGEVSDAYLPNYLGSDQPVYGIRHQSDDGKPARYTTVEEIAAHYLGEIRSVQPQGPYYLGGYCFGGLIAFEMTRQLQKQGQQVAFLALLNPAYGRNQNARIAPTWNSTFKDDYRRHLHVLSSLQPIDKWNYLQVRVGAKVKETVRWAFEPVKRIIRRIVCKVSIRFGHPIPVIMRSPYILEIYRKAIRRYEVQPLNENIVLFVTHDFPENLRINWSVRSTGSVTIHEVPGDHTSVLDDIQVKVWAEKLKSCLDAARVT